MVRVEIEAALRLAGGDRWAWPAGAPPCQLGVFVAKWSNDIRRLAVAPRVHVVDTVYPSPFDGPGALSKIGTESKLQVCGWSGPGYAIDGVDNGLLRPPQPHASQLGTVYATKRRRRNGKRLVFEFELFLELPMCDLNLKSNLN
ncbi:unnamed protein product [Colias eurytheme]|nr:unnamed protein product [Colias eurytheme]